MLSKGFDVLLMHNVEQFWSGPNAPVDIRPIPLGDVVRPLREDGLEELEPYSVGKSSRPAAMRMPNHMSAFTP